MKAHVKAQIAADKRFSRALDKWNKAQEEFLKVSLWYSKFNKENFINFTRKEG
jgi:hypothetical protein